MSIASGISRAGLIHSLCLIAEALSASGGRSVDLYDLGSGLGAMQWACGLVYAAMAVHKQPLPDLRIVSIDTSPFMVEYQRRLWSHFTDRYPVCKNILNEYELNSWVNRRKEYNPVWISASYLFDHSDKQDQLVKDFVGLIDAYHPEQVFLASSNQLNKQRAVLHVTQQFTRSGYEPIDILDEQLFHGEAELLTAVRAKLDEKLRVNKPVQWSEMGFFGTALMRQQSGLSFDRAANPDKRVAGIDLFNPPMIVRRDIALATDQIEAAVHKERPAFIFGPAGCGKSVVITERIKNLVESANYAPSFRILVTTFNKELIKALHAWLKSILDPEFCSTPGKNGFDYTEYEFYFRDSTQANIVLMHFDILPTRIGRLNGSVMNESVRTHIIEGIIEEIWTEIEHEGLRIENPERILNVDFVRDEYDRVFYGQWLRDEAAYLDGARPGRPTLVRNQGPRRLAWRCISRLHQCVTTAGRTPFINKRMLFREQLENGDHNDLFTHIFVDEFQDCTASDFQIFYRLLTDPNHLVVAGDLAQALHLGRSASFPRLPDSHQRNIERKELKGSYRLPFRISEALLELSGRIYDKRKLCGDSHDVRMLNPYKGSPPGARPIIIWAPTVDELANKTCAAIERYRVYGIDRVKVMETDNYFSTALNRMLDINVGADSVLRFKGLECTCVVWSTRVQVLNDEEAEEFVYTILTRTSGILIVALCPETRDIYKPILNTFDRNRLIFWDGVSWNRFKDFCVDRELHDDYEPQTEFDEESILA
ncbi:MAG: UvrD-helicase domain-containing protein [Rhodothermales bacterium]